ncbi:MAG: hypothetical protein P9L88_05305 [Candidatus Tantalella remota]|nr:hypothetical protein [Candidatus Tantalella remota]
MIEQRFVKEAIIGEQFSETRKDVTSQGGVDEKDTDSIGIREEVVTESYSYEMPVARDLDEIALRSDTSAENVIGISTQPIISPLGSALLVKNAANVSGKVYSWLDTKVSSIKKRSGDRITQINPENVPENVRGSLDQLFEVEGVSLSIPGVDYVVPGIEDLAAQEQTVIEENLFTIDRISLEKTACGKFVSRVPPDVVNDLDRKLLCFSSSPDAFGKTVAVKLEEGCVATLAKVLVKWASYSRMGFDFDKETEEKVVKAVIRAVGVGVEDAFVMLEESEMSSGELEAEIKKIIGNDQDAMSRIYGFIGSRGETRKISTRIER